MKVKVDDFGRVLIPKRIRDHLGLRSGITIKLEEKGGGELLMCVVRKEPLLEEQDGVLVFKGAPIGDIEDTINEMREDRIKHLIEDSE